MCPVKRAALEGDWRKPSPSNSVKEYAMLLRF
jgi:hypothetical protein